MCVTAFGGRTLEKKILSGILYVGQRDDGIDEDNRKIG